MLYQKGEKLKELRQTIKDIPVLAKLKQSDFVLSKSEFKKFKAPIMKLFNNLNSVLFDTLTNGKTNDENRTAVYKAIGKIFVYLEENYDHDLRQYFYEEKLAFYENMFVILVRDELYKRYKEYKDLLEGIPKMFWIDHDGKLTTDFPKISYQINVHNEIIEDIENRLHDSTIMYLNHSLEMIYEKISKLIKEECEARYLNPDVLPSRLRRIIYLLKSELPIVFEEDED